MHFAILCNSAAIEMYGDKIRVSHGFEDCQMLKYIKAGIEVFFPISTPLYLESQQDEKAESFSILPLTLI